VNPAIYLIVDGVELCEDDSVDQMRIRVRRVVGKSGVELDQLKVQKIIIYLIVGYHF
jgi:hypothetical protein